MIDNGLIDRQAGRWVGRRQAGRQTDIMYIKHCHRLASSGSKFWDKIKCIGGLLGSFPGINTYGKKGKKEVGMKRGRNQISVHYQWNASA